MVFKPRGAVTDILVSDCCLRPLGGGRGGNQAATLPALRGHEAWPLVSGRRGLPEVLRGLGV